MIKLVNFFKLNTANCFLGIVASTTTILAMVLSLFIADENVVLAQATTQNGPAIAGDHHGDNYFGGNVGSRPKIEVEADEVGNVTGVKGGNCNETLNQPSSIKVKAKKIGDVTSLKCVGE